MIKSELVLRIAAKIPHLSEWVIERDVHTILGRISDALVAGDRVELRGLGTFTVKERGAWSGRNPATGEVVFVEAKRSPRFKSSKSMHARMNPSGRRVVTRSRHLAG